MEFAVTLGPTPAWRDPLPAQKLSLTSRAYFDSAFNLLPLGVLTFLTKPPLPAWTQLLGGKVEAGTARPRCTFAGRDTRRHMRAPGQEAWAAVTAEHSSSHCPRLASSAVPGRVPRGYSGWGRDLAGEPLGQATASQAALDSPQPSPQQPRPRPHPPEPRSHPSEPWPHLGCDEAAQARAL
ncbi:hypothetical protein P7K49_033725 [Saguinus oedipus]|uniref:Uncharacterized protein n=1 Tax=Saguinus oedipus TaxID=9490 RepID=A0ABQ9TTT3_SAGOE|nr:hypothetical protein P7K49_033725 [Saguinus oedipus]